MYTYAWHLPVSRHSRRRALPRVNYFCFIVTLKISHFFPRFPLLSTTPGLSSPTPPLVVAWRRPPRHLVGRAFLNSTTVARTAYAKALRTYGIDIIHSSAWGEHVADSGAGYDDVLSSESLLLYGRFPPPRMNLHRRRTAITV